MKKLIINLIFIIPLLQIHFKAGAQQAKAYENVHFNAKNGAAIFKLDYADGYIGASKITLHQPHQKTITFMPENGTMEQNGSFTFLPVSTKDKSHIVLQNVNDEATAPPTINALYYTNGQRNKLVFRQINK